MGHESQIEPWLAHDQRSACWFHKSLASSQIEYENHRGTTHKRYAVVRSVPSLWSGMREQSGSIPRHMTSVLLAGFTSHWHRRKSRMRTTGEQPTSATRLSAASRAFGATCENNPAQFQGG